MPSRSRVRAGCRTVRYSAPAIIGALSTREASSASRRRGDGRKGGGLVGVRAGGVQAERADVAGGELAPPDEGGRQGLAELGGAQAHQAVAGSLGEGFGQAGRQLGFDVRRVVLVFDEKAAVWGEAQSELGMGGV